MLTLLLGTTDLAVQQHPPEVLDLKQPVVVAVSERSVKDENVHQLLACLFELGGTVGGGLYLAGS